MNSSVYSSAALAVMLITVATSNAWSQAGVLLGHTKINSATLDAVGLPLDDADEFGDAVTSLGDLDGPGPSAVALVVGAVGDDDGGSHRGAVYVNFLDATGALLSYQKISATSGGFTGVLDSGDEFGGAVTGLGDLDGDGPSVAALAVGAIGDDDGGTDAGAVYILFLNAAGQVLSQRKITEGHGGFVGLLDDLDEFGGALGSVGDLDGDGPGAGALAVGVIGDDDGGSARGATYILFLGANGSVLSQRKISNTTGGFTAALSDNDDFGEDVAGLGDLDGPGPSAGALAATAVGDDDGSNDAGAVYILFLDTTGLVLSHRKISSTTGGFTGTLSADDNFGTAVANLGDLDGSGPSAIAIAVGSGGHDGAGVDRGAEYTLLLDATGLVLSHVEISSTAGFGAKLDDTDEFASALVALGDIDGQGPARQTLAAAASFDDDGGPDRGAVYLLSLDGSANVGVPGTALPSLLSTLGAARPNPFRAETTIPFRLAESGAVRIRIVDVRGRRVRDLIQYARAGEHRVVWDGLDDSGRPSAPGSYYIQLAVNGRTLAGERAVRLR